MTLKVGNSIRFSISLFWMVAMPLILGMRLDWATKLEEKRIRLQADMDHLTKYFCSYGQNDANCQVRLPQLREELRQIDEQLLGYRRSETRHHLQELSQEPQQTHSVIDLIRNRSYVQAEQDLLNHLDDTHSVVQNVYDNRVENFNVLLDFASVIRDGKLKFLIYKNLLANIVRQGHDDPIKVVRLIRGVQEEILPSNTIEDEIHEKATNMVRNLKHIFEVAVVKLWADKQVNGSFEKDTSVPALADEISTLDQGFFTEIISKVVTSVYPQINTDQLMRNMETFHLIPQLIDAYTAIYNAMAQNNDINGKRYILKLGYYLRELLERSNSTQIQITPEKKMQLQITEQKLPACIRSLIFYDRVCLKSKYVHDYLQIAHGHPRLRRNAIMGPGKDLKWKPKHIDYNVFFEYPYGGDLYADTDNHDGRNRLVGVSGDLGMISGSEWHIEPSGDDCLIRNVVHNEFLFVSTEFDEVHQSYKVFTRKASDFVATGDDRFRWAIEECL